MTDEEYAGVNEKMEKAEDAVVISPNAHSQALRHVNLHNFSRVIYAMSAQIFY